MNRDKRHDLNLSSRPVLRNLALCGILTLATNCAPQATSGLARNGNDSTFTRVKPVLERNCVHCHGTTRLRGMPSMVDTMALADDIGSGELIVPGRPEQSRFFKVVILEDDQAGAMPPTGHAISKSEVNAIRKWIEAGAPLPAENVQLESKGQSPRSR